MSTTTDDVPSPVSVRGYKHRLNQLFSPNVRDRIRDAVHYVHAVMCNASLLVKFRVTRLALSSADHSLPPLFLNEKEVWNAIRAVQSGPVTQALVPSSSARINKKASDATDAKTERDALYSAWRQDYTDMTSRCLDAPPLAQRGMDLSVSHILGVAAKQYTSSVLTNVRYHYRSYVCCALGIVLRSKALAMENTNSDACFGTCTASTFDDLPSSSKKRWRREFGKAYEDVLCHRSWDDMKCDPALRSVVNRHRSRLVPHLPSQKRSIDSDLDDSKRVFVYLGYMIRLASFVERAGNVSRSREKRRTLLSPVPLKTSFIPAHYTIDTTGLVHLLLKDVRSFKRYFEENLRDKGGFELPKLTSKANICASLSTLAERPVTTRDEEMYKDALWTYVARFRNRRTKRLNPLTKEVTTKEGSMRFAHSICTDGYSVTLVCNNEEVRARKHVFSSGSRPRKRKQSTVDAEDEVPEAFRQEFPLLTADTASDVIRYLKDIGCEDYTSFVGGDPGKSVLLALVNEFRRKLCYTSAQRRRETDGNSHKRIRRSRLGEPVEKTHRKGRNKTRKRDFVTSSELRSRETNRRYPGVIRVPDRRPHNPPRHMICLSAAMLEAEMCKRRLTSKSSDSGRLKDYVAYREASRSVFETTYQKPVFRAMRFTSWTKRKASVERFAEQILAKFGSRASVNRKVVILYGDWGRHPNLKNQAPSPGIGLRRALHGYRDRITTITVRETYTSSYDPNTGNEVTEARGIHALLRDTSMTGCRRGVYWSRDVLGSLNILRKGCYLLRQRAAHPLFGK